MSAPARFLAGIRRGRRRAGRAACFATPNVNAALVRDDGKCFTLKLSLFAMFPNSVRYLAMCSTVDSHVSSPNLVYLGIFQPLGFSIYTMYSAKGEEYVGLCNGVFSP